MRPLIVGPLDKDGRKHGTHGDLVLTNSFQIYRSLRPRPTSFVTSNALTVVETIGTVEMRRQLGANKKRIKVANDGKTKSALALDRSG